MFRLISIELIKTFKLKQIYLSMIGAVFFALIVFINYIGQTSISAFMIPIAVLGNLTQTFIIIIFLGFAAYIYGVEIQEETLKILYSKAISAWKIVLAKFIVGIIYLFVLIYIVGGIVSLISLAFYPQIDWHEFEGENLISAQQGLKYLFFSYSLQGLSLIFIICLSITLAIIFNSAVLSIILTFFIMLFSYIGGNIEFIRPILPTTYWLVWQDIIKQNILWEQVLKSIGILLLYSLVLYVLAVFFYKNKEVTN